MKQSNLILGALLLSIGVMAGLIVQGNSAPPTTGADKKFTQAINSEPPPHETAALVPNDDSEEENTLTPSDLEQMAQQLAQERKKRKALEKQVFQLGEQVKQLALKVNSDANDEDARKDTTIRTGARNIPQKISGWVDAKRLTEAGMTSDQADSIRQLYESVEMDKLYLRDRAQREGWMASQRFRDEMDKLDERTRNLRNELGEQAYDALLYATGRPNRVIVEGTLGNSPAAQAGIKKGDAILRYADKPIYSWFDLRSATTEGDASEMVALEIQRGDKQMEIYVKRGPLGIRLDQESVNPAK